MLAGLLLLPVLIYAQANNQKQEVAKGYYSIGNNAKKLKPKELPIQIVEAADIGTSVIQKGYYSIKGKDSNRTKQFIMRVGNRKAPVINKGYYSIGNNAKKLVQ